MNILVTGGLGHIGSSLIRIPPKFDELGAPLFNITTIDNLLTQRYCSLFNLETPVKFIDKCINEINPKDLRAIDVVIHLAATTNAEGSFDNKKQTEEINSRLTSKFIDKCEEAGCKFIFPSSTSVYGVAADIVHEDDDSFLNPQSPYAESKISIENKLKSYKNDYLILRFGTIFGASPGMRFHTAINKFCYEASLSKPLTIWRENYNHYRPYLGLKDAVNAIFFLIQKDIWNNTYNVLTGNYKLSEIVSDIKEIIDIEINMTDTPLLNQFSYKVSDAKIKSLGFEPRGNLHNSIRETLSLLRNLNGQS